MKQFSQFTRAEVDDLVLKVKARIRTRSLELDIRQMLKEIECGIDSGLRFSADEIAAIVAEIERRVIPEEVAGDVPFGTLRPTVEDSERAIKAAFYADFEAACKKFNALYGSVARPDSDEVLALRNEVHRLRGQLHLAKPHPQPHKENRDTVL